MSQCPFNHALRPELPPLNKRIAALPVSKGGYPIPFFVEQKPGDDDPDFRVASGHHKHLCEKLRLCWVCGQPLGAHLAFTIGPMCAINRTTAEPPEHLDCALWSVKGCPFLSRPKMKRREDEDGPASFANVAGIAITRNPGASAIWVTKSYTFFKDGSGGKLIRLGDPIDVTWWREGRPANRAEVMESITTGLPFFKERCRDQRDLDALADYQRKMMHLVPAL